ncbi:MAG: hypothetical protein ACJ8DI_12140 [Ktedonobacteraceae bacterium]
MERWNIFARELEDILADHGLRLGQLDDRAFIHREKVRRLRKSLERPKCFPVLNPDEMDEVIAAVPLNDYEVLRLRAAILTAAIQETLVERIDPEDAFIAAEQIFPTIMMAMHRRSDETVGLARMRGESTSGDEEGEIDEVPELALVALDRATKALHLGCDEQSDAAERREQLQRARAGFEAALVAFVAAPEAARDSAAWRSWYAEARQGLSLAGQSLQALGATDIPT